MGCRAAPAGRRRSAPAKILNMIITVGEEPHVMAMQFRSAVPAAILAGPVANLSEAAGDITRALDMPFQGF